MFYKKKDNEWLVGIEIRLPIAFDSEILNSENRKSIDGWEWFDEPPTEYLEWKSQQDIQPFSSTEPQF